MTRDDAQKLDAAFAEMRESPVPVSEALMDRIMRDADDVLVAMPPVIMPPVISTGSRKGLGQTLLEAIGGWPSLGGLVAATVAGVWIGVSPPDVLTAVSAPFFGDTIEVPLLESDIFAAWEG